AVFRRVLFPLMMPTIVVVGTTLVIFALKAFDVVYVMTGGNYNTDVLAFRMYEQLYTAGNSGHASAVAVILLIAVIPVLIFNLRQFRYHGDQQDHSHRARDRKSTRLNSSHEWNSYAVFCLNKNNNN